MTTHCARTRTTHTSILVLLLGLTLFGAAGNHAYYQLPPESFEIVDGVLVVTSDETTRSFVPGLGWVPEALPDLPRFEPSGVSVSAATLDALGLEQHRLDAVRFSGDVELRIVLDLSGALDVRALTGLDGEGILAEGASLKLQLPPLLLPDSQPELPAGYELRLHTDRNATHLTLQGPPLHYDIFTLVEPNRVVLDLVPLHEAKTFETKELAPGVVYRRFGTATEIGNSTVHVLAFEPGSGAFRVVGTSGVARPLSELADGAFAAINAGYFDTDTFAAIGFLEVDDGLLSLPSRNRASVGFGTTGAVIDRVAAEVTVRVDGVAVFTSSLSVANSIAASTAAGSAIGTPRVGVLTVASGVAQENKIGPRTVPENGFALSYPADSRALALVNPGDRVALEVRYHPTSFNNVHYAVEAGPLLVSSGRPAFQPEREAFQMGQRILDAYTQQAAIGLGEDGAVYFVVAEAMNAAGLVPLLISLGIRDAMRLDSGSSTMLLADGQLLNRAQERRVVSAIVFLPDVR